MKRDASIEFFRCLCMFGVVLLHALDQGGYADGHRGLDNLMTPSVVGFIFISGWFGIKFKLKSAMKLIGIGVASAAMITFVYHVLWCGELGAIGFVKHVWEYTQYAWFLWMYLALMTLAPLVEPILNETDGGGQIRKVMPFVAAIFVWSYLATKVPVFKDWTPTVTGFHPFGVLTFLGVYIVARLCQATGVGDRCRCRWLVCAAVVSGAACWSGFMHYSSPFALVFAGSLFLLVRRIGGCFNAEAQRRGGAQRVLGCLRRMVLWMGPSMFSVYLLHNNAAGLTWLQQAEDYLIRDSGWNYYAACFLVAICVFIGGILLDLPRRFLSASVGKCSAKMV